LLYVVQNIIIKTTHIRLYCSAQMQRQSKTPHQSKRQLRFNVKQQSQSRCIQEWQVDRKLWVILCAPSNGQCLCSGESNNYKMLFGLSDMRLVLAEQGV